MLFTFFSVTTFSTCNFWISNIIALFIGYLVGHLIFAKLLSYFTHTRIDSYYSKNLGATNVARVMGISYGLSTFSFDMAKVVIISYTFFLFKMEIVFFASCFYLLAGVGAFFGHCLPIMYKFKGGKGLSCLAGLIVVFNPWLACLLIPLYILLSLFVKNSIYSMLLTMIVVIGCLFTTVFGTTTLAANYHYAPHDPKYLYRGLIIFCCAWALIFHWRNFTNLIFRRTSNASNPLFVGSVSKKLSSAQRTHAN